MKITNKLFLIAIGDKPLLMRGGLVLLYSDKAKADITAVNFRQTYNDEEIKTLALESNEVFFAKMIASGFRKFLLNGEGEVFDFTNYCSVDLVKKANNPQKLYEDIINAQPQRIVHAMPVDESIIKVIKRLPKIHRNRLIIAYACGIISVIFAVVGTIFDIHSFLFLTAFYVMFFGIVNALKVSDKLREKNPRVAKLAKLSLLFYVIFAILFIYMINSDTNTKENSPDFSSYEASEYEPEDNDVVNNSLTGHEKAKYGNEKLYDVSETVIDVNDIIGNYKKNVRSYEAKVPYAKGKITKGVYRSEFISLYGRLPKGYSWMSDEEQEEIIVSDKYQIDCEVGVRGKSNDARKLLLFTVKVGKGADYDKCIEVLKDLNTDFTLDINSMSGTTIFTNMGFDDPDLQDRRKYDHASFSDENVERTFTFNKVNDRLVCILQQYAIDSEDERLDIFCEY